MLLLRKMFEISSFKKNLYYKNIIRFQMFYLNFMFKIKCFLFFCFSPKEYPDYELCYPYYVPLSGLDMKLANGNLPYNGLGGDIAQQVRIEKILVD